MKKLLSTILFFLLLTLFSACKTETDYNYKEKETETQLPDISTAYTMNQAATKVYFYKQKANGEPDLSSFERDTSADIESTSIPAGTRISQLNSLKSYKGFTFYMASQIEEVLNIYFSRNKVTYEFYSSKANSQLVYKTTGLFESKLTPPEYQPLDKTMLVGWEDSDRNLLGSTYGDTDKQYFPRLLEDALGTKNVADTPGDILLDDGSVISYGTFCAKSDDEKATLALHAFGVLVMANYNSDQLALTAPGDGDKEFYYKNIGNDESRAAISSGDKKLIAAVFKEKDTLYNDIPWLSNNDTLLKSSMTLTNYFDGSRNIAQLENFDLSDGDFKQGVNAISTSKDYGSVYCADTVYAEGWHLPSIGELGVFHDAFNTINYDTLLDYFYNTSSRPVWTSNATSQSYDSSAIYTWEAKKSWAVELESMTTSQKTRDQTGCVIPFLICD